MAGVLALGAAACFSDPTSGARGGPARLEFVDVGSTIGAPSISYLGLHPGHDTVNLNIRVLDNGGNPQAFTIDTTAGYVSTNTAVFTVIPFPDPTLRTTPGNTGTKATVLFGGTAGSAYLRITAAGLTDSILVVNFPATFAGAVAPAAAAEGAAVTITASNVLTFTPTATVTIGGVAAFIKSQSANSIVFYAGSAGASQPVVINGLVFLGSIPLTTLTATTAVTVATANEPANDAVGGAVAIPLPTTVGAFTEVVGSISTADADDYWSFTTTTADSLEIQLQWPDAVTDNDALILNATATACVPASCPAAGSSDPEVEKFRFAATTTYLIDVNHFAGSTVQPYRIRIYKRG